MAVSGSDTFSLYQFRQDIVQLLGVDGYFDVVLAATSDLSGGLISLTVGEPNDAQLATRALWILDAKATSALTTGGDGILTVTYKNGGVVGSEDDPDEEQIGLTGVAAATVTNYIPTAGGGSLGAVLRSRGWIVPSFNSSSQEVSMLFQWTQPAVGQEYRVKVYGYYVILR